MHEVPGISGSARHVPEMMPAGELVGSFWKKMRLWESWLDACSEASESICQPRDAV